MNKKYGIIYLIRNKINNKLYIGQTINGFKGRYKNGNICGYSHNEHLINSIKKYGMENFKITEEFDIAYSKEELDKLEKMYIKAYDTTNPNLGYNKQSGGHNGTHSIETKLKMSQNHYDSNGDNNPFYGKHHTQETKAIISNINKGNSYALGCNRTEDFKKHLSEVKMGISTATEHTKEIWSVQRMGANNPSARKVYMIDKNSNNILNKFNTIKEAIEWIVENTHFEKKVIRSMIGSIVRVCKGNSKTAYGYKWKYADEGATTIPIGSTVDDELPLEVQNIL